MKSLKYLLKVLLNCASALGLKDKDVNNARDLLDHEEFELCLDMVITQMYEYDIEINADFYKLIDEIGFKMNIPEEKYSFMKELIRDENNIPKPVKEEIAKLINSLR